MKRVLSYIASLFRKEPAPSFLVEVMRDDDWEAVAMGFSSPQAAVDYAKQHYTSAWQADRVRVRSI